MNIRKIRFWDTENNFMITAPVSCVTAFRNHLSVSPQLGFSDIDGTPHPNKYIPMLFTGIIDSFEREVYEGDIVQYKPDGYSCAVEFEVVFDEGNACFGLFPREKGNYNSHFIQEDTMPLFGCPPGSIERIGNIYEN